MRTDACLPLPSNFNIIVCGFKDLTVNGRKSLRPPAQHFHIHVWRNNTLLMFGGGVGRERKTAPQALPQVVQDFLHQSSLILH